MTYDERGIYISGPMRRYEGCNFPAFHAAEKWLRAYDFGNLIYNPARKDEDSGFVPEGDCTEGIDQAFLQHAMRWDVEKVLASRLIVLLPGWAASTGAKLELAVGRAVGVRAAELIYENGQPSHLFFTSDADLDAAITPPTGRSTPTSADVISIAAVAEAMNLGVSGEVRVRDAATGGEKGSKPAQLGALDPSALLDVATVAGFGATKYALFNYTKGYAWSLSYNALQRHLLAWAGGEDVDPESGLTHLAHAAWHCLALITFQRFERGTDDRFPLRAAV